MSDCLTPADLNQILAGTLPESAAATARAHLLACALCRERLDRLSNDDSLRRWAPAAERLRRQPLEGPGLKDLLQKLAAHPMVDTVAEEPASRPTADTNPELGPAGTPGELGMLGHFRLQAELGRGGMGIVYRAYDDALQRTVAIKVLRPELAGDGDPGRLLREAQAAARFQHEHVVTVHAVVQPPGAAPYLVMEYVDGPTLAARLRAEKHLPPAAAALLGVQVADGLAAAHAAGLIHRDIKPSNLLCETRKGRVKILDFGLARLAERPGPYTIEGQIAGTPEYMSPEQIDRPEAVDARTDVYGLGVTLYETLTGALPFRGTPGAVFRQILHEEPRPPRQLNDAIPRDLETICLKAMAKEPARRYPSAAELAADLRRWQHGEPIHARPAGRVEKLWRWVRRNPRVAALSAALVLVLLAGLAGVTWQWQRAEDNAALAQREAEANAALAQAKEREAQAKEREAAEARRQKDRAEKNLREARRQKDRAEKNLRDACKVVDAFFTWVSSNKLSQLPGAQLLQKELLAGALGYYRTFLQRHGGDPALEQETANAALRVANLAWEIGQTDEALAACAAAARRYEALVRKAPTDAGNFSKLAHCHNLRGILLQRAGRAEEAALAYQTAAAACERGLKAGPASLSLRGTLACLYGNIANLYQGRREPAEVLAWYQKSQAAWEALAAQQPGNGSVQINLALNLHNMAMHQTDLAERLRLLLQARERREQLYKAEPSNHGHGYHLARTLQLLALTQDQQGKPAEAAATFAEARRVLEPIARANPAVKKYQFALGQLFYNLGVHWATQKQWEKALADLAEARAAGERLARPDPAYADAWGLLLSSVRAIAQVQRKQGRQQEAVATLLEGVQLRPEDAGQLFKLACSLARCLPDPATSADAAFAERCAGHVVQTLRQAVRRGFRDRKQLEEAPALAPVRGRPAFQALLAELPKS
jgi:tetratricopeptide (TPR) repeat protein